MSFTALKSTVLGALLVGSSSFLLAVPDLSWDLTTSFNVNSLGAGSVIGGNTPGADYKYDVASDDTPATETGSAFWTNALTTTISADGMTAWVTWSPLGSISFDEVMVKAAASYILWDTSGVNWSLYSGFYVTQNQIIQGKGKAQSFNGISHISLNGEPSVSVPDTGATVLLIGLGLAALGMVTRRRSV